jgi:hypothetical protein
MRRKPAEHAHEQLVEFLAELDRLGLAPRELGLGTIACPALASAYPRAPSHLEIGARQCAKSGCCRDRPAQGAGTCPYDSNRASRVNDLDTRVMSY